MHTHAASPSHEQGPAQCQRMSWARSAVAQKFLFASHFARVLTFLFLILRNFRFFQRGVQAIVAAERLAMNKHRQESARIAAAHPIAFSVSRLSKQQNQNIGAAAAAHITQDTKKGIATGPSSCDAIAHSTRAIHALSLEREASDRSQAHNNTEEGVHGMCSGSAKDVTVHAHCIFERDLCMDAVGTDETTTAEFMCCHGSSHNNNKHDSSSDDVHAAKVHYSACMDHKNNTYQIPGACASEEDMAMRGFAAQHTSASMNNNGSKGDVDASCCCHGHGVDQDVRLIKERLRAAHVSTSLKDLLCLHDTPRLVAA